MMSTNRSSDTLRQTPAAAGNQHHETATTPTAEARQLQSSLPPHLREICTILAAGLLRLRRRNAEDFARDTALAQGGRESSLHFNGHQSGHANPRMKATA
jgi:hypothetical protein